MISLPQRSKCGCCGLIYYTKSSSLQRKRRVDFPATYQEVGSVARWARPAVSVPLLGLAVHWRQQTLRKQERPEQLGAGTDILFGRRSLSSHTRLSLFLSLYVVPLPILLSVWHWHFDKVRELGKDRCSASTDPTMCWHGDEEDEDSAEVTCSTFVFLSRCGPACVQIVNCGTFKLRRKGNFSFVVFLKPVNKDKVIKTLWGNNGSMGNDL